MTHLSNTFNKRLKYAPFSRALYMFREIMKFYKTYVIVIFSFLASAGNANNAVISKNTNCESIVAHFGQFRNEQGVLILNKVPGDVETFPLGGLNTKEKHNLSSPQLSLLKRIWLRYEDIDNDNKKELFTGWVSYANTYTDNRSSIYVFNYPNHDHLEDMFLKGKYKSEFYPDFESWMINNFEWDSYNGPVGAQNALPENLEFPQNEVWTSGKGFSKPPNDYFLTVFSLNGVHYVLVSGRHVKNGQGRVIKLTSVENQKYEFVCKVSLESM